VERAIQRPHRPVPIGGSPPAAFDLHALAASLAADPALAGGKTGVTLARGDGLALVLASIRAGEALREHRAPAPGAVVLLAGRARFRLGDATVELHPGAVATFGAGEPHALEATDADATCLIVLGGAA
jgi:quercetin dioxygenase-like cupin family protein